MPDILEMTFLKMSSSKKLLSPKGVIGNRAALAQLMTWCWTGYKPSTEPMLNQFNVNIHASLTILPLLSCYQKCFSLPCSITLTYLPKEYFGVSIQLWLWLHYTPFNIVVADALAPTIGEVIHIYFSDLPMAYLFFYSLLRCIWMVKNYTLSWRVIFYVVWEYQLQMWAGLAKII